MVELNLVQASPAFTSAACEVLVYVTHEAKIRAVEITIDENFIFIYSFLEFWQ
jgi:hypothetical protein